MIAVNHISDFSTAAWKLLRFSWENSWFLTGLVPVVFVRRVNSDSEKIDTNDVTMTSWCNFEIIAWTSCRSKSCQVFQKCFCSSIFRSWEIQEDHQWLIRACRQILKMRLSIFSRIHNFEFEGGAWADPNKNDNAKYEIKSWFERYPYATRIKMARWPEISTVAS